MIFEKAVLSVSELNTRIKRTINNNPELKFVYIKGEISNFKPYPSGHIYFSLKDEESYVSAVMFYEYAKKMAFEVKNGDEVIIYASVDVYVPRGNYQLTVYEMEPVGKGNQLIELEKLKKKLQQEGLFDASRKRQINIFPKAIGIITAINGAAIKDLLFNIKRRYSVADIYVFPSSVQGENAPKELLKAFNISQTYPLDTLIIGRGGGASEDLSSFNDETLVRAVASSKMPVISAVGHEIDITLVDFVADKRASTPTAAAELATVDKREILDKLVLFETRMKEALIDKVKYASEELENYKEELNDNIINIIKTHKLKLEGIKNHLEALSPTNILSRGYSITLNASGQTLKSLKQINKDEEIVTILSDGKLISKVDKKEKK